MIAVAGMASVADVLLRVVRTVAYLGVRIVSRVGVVPGRVLVVDGRRAVRRVVLVLVWHGILLTPTGCQHYTPRGYAWLGVPSTTIDSRSPRGPRRRSTTADPGLPARHFLRLPGEGHAL